MRPILIYLLLGTLLNVAVACCIVLAHGTVWLRHSPVLVMHGERDIFCFRTQMCGHTVVTASGNRIPFPRSEVPEWLPLESKAIWLPGHVLDDLVEDTSVTVIAAGWPWKSLRTWSAPTHGQYEWGVEMPPRDVFAWVSRTDGRALPIVLPLQPVPLGFVLNTLICATALRCAVAARAFAATFLRSRRGLCPRCAYPRESHAICPECGRVHERGLADVHAHTAPPA